MNKPLFVEKSDLLRGVLPAQRNAEIVPMPKFIRFDPMLDGNYRFCKALGSQVANLVSSTSFEVAEAAVVGDNVIVTNTLFDDPAGMLILLDNTEACIVSSYTETRNDNGIQGNLEVEAAFHFNHVIGSQCSFEAFEVFTSAGASYPIGSTFIQLASRKPLVAGDHLAKLVNSSFNAVLSNYIELESVTLDSTSGEYFNYSVVTKPMPFEIAQDRIFVKAIPAYSSNKLQLQTTSSHVVVDSLHGKTFGQGQAEITVGLQLFDVSGNMISSKSLPLGDQLRISALRVHEIAAMHVERGSVCYAQAQTFICDDEGLFCVGSQFTEMELEVAFNLSGYGTLIVETDIVETFTVEGYLNYSRVSLTDKFILRFVSAPGVIFTVRDSSQYESKIHSMRYTLCADVATGEEFSLSGLLLKPVFKSLLDCTPDSTTVDLNMGMILT